ncbi:hypothetical protein G6F59_017464 [Rhizopus arrhizus]|nr:hypothetical protein G6F59_017464 [Rhizopus arrhizus]
MRCRGRRAASALNLGRPSGLGAGQRDPVHPGALSCRCLGGERAKALDKRQACKLDVALGPVRTSRREHEVVPLKGPTGGAVMGQVGLP